MSAALARREIRARPGRFVWLIVAVTVAVGFTVGAFGFYWFHLDPNRQEARFASSDPTELARLTIADEWTTLFKGRGRAALEKALPAFLTHNRWYAGRQRVLRSATTVVHLVTLLEDMPVTETEEAVAAVRPTQIRVGTGSVKSSPA